MPKNKETPEDELKNEDCLEIPLEPQRPVPQEPQPIENPQIPIPEAPVRHQGEITHTQPMIPQQTGPVSPMPYIPQIQPVIPQIQPQVQAMPPQPAPKAGYVTKAQAANEVMIHLGKIKQIAIVSMIMVLAVGGLWNIDSYIGAVAAIIYVVYAAIRMMRANQYSKYLKLNYGV